MDDVIEYENINSLLCPCDKYIHWEKYEECKICRDGNNKENNSETDKNNTSEEEHNLLNEIVLQIQNNEQDSNCSETLHYCAHCDYATKRKFNMKDHIERKYAREEEIICCNNEKSHMECIPKGEKDDLFEDSIEVWKIYKLLQRMKNK